MAIRKESAPQLPPGLTPGEELVASRLYHYRDFWERHPELTPKYDPTLYAYWKQHPTRKRLRDIGFLQPAADPKEIAQTTELSTSYVRFILSRLVNRGVVCRMRRGVYCSPTILQWERQSIERAAADGQTLVRWKVTKGKMQMVPLECPGQKVLSIGSVKR